MRGSELRRSKALFTKHNSLRSFPLPARRPYRKQNIKKIELTSEFFSLDVRG